MEASLSKRGSGRDFPARDRASVDGICGVKLVEITWPGSRSSYSLDGQSAETNKKAAATTEFLQELRRRLRRGGRDFKANDDEQLAEAGASRRRDSGHLRLVGGGAVQPGEAGEQRTCHGCHAGGVEAASETAGDPIVATLLQVLAEWNRSRDEKALRQVLARVLTLL